MSVRLLVGVYAVVLTALTSASYAGPCGQDIFDMQAKVDAKLEAIAAAGPPASASAMAGDTSAQPTPRSMAAVEERMGELSPEKAATIEQGMGRARAADAAGDKVACEQALADVRRALGQ